MLAMDVPERVVAPLWSVAAKAKDDAARTKAAAAAEVVNLIMIRVLSLIARMLRGKPSCTLLQHPALSKSVRLACTGDKLKT
jgi:hypothetical protein